MDTTTIASPGLIAICWLLVILCAAVVAVFSELGTPNGRRCVFRVRDCVVRSRGPGAGELDASHSWLPFGSRVRLINRDRFVVVTVRSRVKGPDCEIELSPRAFDRLSKEPGERVTRVIEGADMLVLPNSTE